MSFAPKSETQRQMAAEIGIMRYEAVGHFLVDGAYKADHEGDFEGAFADYTHANHSGSASAPQAATWPLG